jgi:hypothetical protein
MSALSQHEEETESSSDAVDEPIGSGRTISIARILVGTTLATGAALLSVFVGIPILAATAAGAVVGGATVAVLAAQQAPLRR